MHIHIVKIELDVRAKDFDHADGMNWPGHVEYRAKRSANCLDQSHHFVFSNC